MKKPIGGVLLLTFLASCSGRGEAEDVIREMLIDPEGARFGEFTVSDDGTYACLGVNPKNRMGGYNGESQFQLHREEGGWSYSTNSPQTHQRCVDRINSPDYWMRN